MKRRALVSFAALFFIQKPVGLRLTLAVSLLGGLTVWACGGEESTGPGQTPPPAVASVTVTPGTATLVSLGETAQLTASAQDASGNTISGKTFTWSSSDASISTVSTSGLVTAVANGSVTITATTDGITGTASVTVGQAAASLTLAPSSLVLAGPGATATVTASVTDAGGAAVANPTLTWSSADEGIATVSSAGLVTAVAGGSTTIAVEATGGGQTVTGQVSVTVNPTLVVTTTSLPDGVENVDYAQTLTATGGDGSYSWALASGSGPLPTNLSLATNGDITGTPTVVGTSNFNVQVTSGDGQTAVQALSITILDTTPPETTIDGAPEDPSTLVVYDLTSDWSDASNPNGAWTYREGLNPLPHVDDWPHTLSTVAQPAWSRLGTDPNFLPAWFRSTSNNPGGFDFLSGDVVVHSTDTFRGPMGDANVMWTSPVDGTADVSGSVWMVREIGRGNTWQLSLNGTSLTSGHVFSGDPYSRTTPFDFSSGSGGVSALLNISVTAGDEIRLDLLADNPFSGGDFVAMNLTITLLDEATFAFSSSESGSSFECQLDGSGFSACTSPTVYMGLREGDHSFEVRATDAAGNVDASPAVHNWTIMLP